MQDQDGHQLISNGTAVEDATDARGKRYECVVPV